MNSQAGPERPGALLSRMPPESVEVRAYFKRQREERIDRLKAAGLCITCGKVRPPKGRVTCDDCNADAAERQRRIRANKKKTAKKAPSRKAATKPVARKK